MDLLINYPNPKLIKDLKAKTVDKTRKMFLETATKIREADPKAVIPTQL